MKNKFICMTLLLSLIFPAYAQENSTITQEQALQIAKQTIIEKGIQPKEWFDGRTCIEFKENLGAWAVYFNEKSALSMEKGLRVRSISVYLTPTGELRSIFPNH